MFRPGSLRCCDDPVDRGDDLGHVGVAVGVGDLDAEDARLGGHPDEVVRPRPVAPAGAGVVPAGDDAGHVGAVAVGVDVPEGVVLGLEGEVGSVTGCSAEETVHRLHARVDQRDVDALAGEAVLPEVVAPVSRRRCSCHRQPRSGRRRTGGGPTCRGLCAPPRARSRRAATAVGGTSATSVPSVCCTPTTRPNRSAAAAADPRPVGVDSTTTLGPRRPALRPPVRPPRPGPARRGWTARAPGRQRSGPRRRPRASAVLRRVGAASRVPSAELSVWQDRACIS